MRWAESAVQGYHDIGQPAHNRGSHSSGTVEGTAAPTRGAFLDVGGPGWPGCEHWAKGLFLLL